MRWNIFLGIKSRKREVCTGDQRRNKRYPKRRKELVCNRRGISSKDIARENECGSLFLLGFGGNRLCTRRKRLLHQLASYHLEVPVRRSSVSS